MRTTSIVTTALTNPQTAEFVSAKPRPTETVSVSTTSGHTMLIGQPGRPISGNRLTQIVKQVRQQAGIQQRESCYLLRHTAATFTLQGGTDLRSRQVFLGHESLQTK